MAESNIRWSDNGKEFEFNVELPGVGISPKKGRIGHMTLSQEDRIIELAEQTFGQPVNSLNEVFGFVKDQPRKYRDMILEIILMQNPDLTREDLLNGLSFGEITRIVIKIAQNYYFSGPEADNMRFLSGSQEAPTQSGTAQSAGDRVLNGSGTAGEK